MQFSIAIQLASIPQPFERALTTAARLGVAGIELEVRSPITPWELSSTGRRQIRRMLGDAELKVSALSFVTRLGYDNPDQLDRRVSATKEALKLAYDLGTNVVTNRIGRLSADKDDPCRAALKDVLQDIGRHGHRCGALLIARTGSESGDVLADFLDELPTGTLGVDFDPAGLLIEGFSIPHALQRLTPHVMHVRARDAVRHPGEGRGQEVVLGRGMVDFPLVAAHLLSHGYHRFITIQRSGSPDAITELADAVTYLQTMRDE